MTTHVFDIDALNAICVSLGGNGGHYFQMDALNEWCAKAGKAAGHTRSIAAYNALAGGTSFAFDLQAMNDLSGDLGGATNATMGVAALNTIADKVAGPTTPTELAFADFIAKTYRVNGASVPLGQLFIEDIEWGFFNPVTHITAAGLIGNPVVAPGVMPALLASGFTVVGTFAAAANEKGSVDIEALDIPDWSARWHIYLWCDNTVTHLDPTRLMAYDGTEVTHPAVSGVKTFRFAETFTPGRVSLSVDGNVVVTATSVTASGWSILNSLGIAARGVPVRTLTFYPPQPDAALPGLSV